MFRSLASPSPPLFLLLFFSTLIFFFLWFLSFIYLSQRTLLYILSYVIDESKCGVSFPSLTGSLLLRAGSSVPRCLRRDLSTHLFPPACPSCCHTVTAKSMSLLYNTYVLGVFFGWGRGLRFICRIVSDFCLHLRFFWNIAWISTLVICCYTSQISLFHSFIYNYRIHVSIFVMNVCQIHCI